MTTFQRLAFIFCIGFFLAVSCIASFIVGRHTVPRCPPELPPADTVYVTEILHHDAPEPTEVIPAGFELVRIGTVAQLKQTIATLEAAAPTDAEPQDTALVQSPSADSLAVDVPLPIERKVYGGKEGDDYRAVVSGIFPKLESIDVYPKTAYITVPVQEPARRSARVGLGVAAGPGVFWNGSGIQPGLGATVGLTLEF